MYVRWIHLKSLLAAIHSLHHGANSPWTVTCPVAGLINRPSIPSRSYYGWWNIVGITTWKPLGEWRKMPACCVKISTQILFGNHSKTRKAFEVSNSRPRSWYLLVECSTSRSDHVKDKWKALEHELSSACARLLSRLLNQQPTVLLHCDSWCLSTLSIGKNVLRNED